MYWMKHLLRVRGDFWRGFGSGAWQDVWAAWQDVFLGVVFRAVQVVLA